MVKDDTQRWADVIKAADHQAGGVTDGPNPCVIPGRRAARPESIVIGALSLDSGLRATSLRAPEFDEAAHLYPFACFSIAAASNLLMSSIRSLVTRSVAAILSLSTPFFTRKST